MALNRHGRAGSAGVFSAMMSFGRGFGSGIALASDAPLTATDWGTSMTNCPNCLMRPAMLATLSAVPEIDVGPRRADNRRAGILRDQQAAERRLRLFSSASGRSASTQIGVP